MEGDFSMLKVYLGSCKIPSRLPRLNPIRVIMDPEIVYNGSRYIHSILPISTMKLSTFFTTLPNHQNPDDCYIFGYGSQAVYGEPTLDLRIAPVRIISHERCTEQLGPYNAPPLNSGMFCAEGARPGVDACSVRHNIANLFHSFQRLIT